MPHVALRNNPLIYANHVSVSLGGAFHECHQIILALLIPPVAAFLTVGIGLHFWLNILLSIFFWVPGMIHAIWLVLKNAGDQD